MTPVALRLYSFGLEKQTPLISLGVPCSERRMWNWHQVHFHNIKFQGQHRFWSNVHVRKQEEFSVQTMRTLISIYTNTFKVWEVSGLSSRFLWRDKTALGWAVNHLRRHTTRRLDEITARTLKAIAENVAIENDLTKYPQMCQWTLFLFTVSFLTNSDSLHWATDYSFLTVVQSASLWERLG